MTFEGPEIRKIFYGSFHKVSNANSKIMIIIIIIINSHSFGMGNFHVLKSSFM